MVSKITGGGGRRGRSRLVMVVLVVELLLKHEVMVVLRQVRGRVGVSGEGRETEGAERAVLIVVPRGRRGPRTRSGGVPCPASARAAGARGRYEENLTREGIFGQLVSHRDGVPSRTVGPGRTMKSSLPWKIPGHEVLRVRAGCGPVGRVPLVGQEGVGGRRRLGPHARRGEVRLLGGGGGRGRCRGKQPRTRQRRSGNRPGEGGRAVCERGQVIHLSLASDYDPHRLGTCDG